MSDRQPSPTGSTFPDDAAPLVSHEDRLRIVGRSLDLQHYRSAIIVEVPHGVFTRATRIDKHVPYVLELSDTQIRSASDGMRRQRGAGERLDRHPLLPTGYEDFLRALGYWLDERSARWIAIHEFKEFIAVGAYSPRVTFRSTTMEAIEANFGPDEITSLIDDAFRRRGTGRRSVIKRLLGSDSP